MLNDAVTTVPGAPAIAPCPMAVAVICQGKLKQNRGLMIPCAEHFDITNSFTVLQACVPHTIPKVPTLYSVSVSSEEAMVTEDAVLADNSSSRPVLAGVIDLGGGGKGKQQTETQDFASKDPYLKIQHYQAI